jgi:hypothetical protein
MQSGGFWNGEHSLFPKTEICAIGFSSSDLTGALAGLLRRSVDETFKTQCDTEEVFFVWIRCNPLKSPVSAKGIQGNPSFFPWICLDFLALLSRFCVWSTLSLGQDRRGEAKGLGV